MKTDVSNNTVSKGIFNKVGAAFNSLPFRQKKKVSKQRRMSDSGEISSMLCPVTGSLNRIGLRKYFDQMTPSDIKSTSLILINIENLSEQLPDKLLQSFVASVIDLCGPKELIARWSIKEFLLVCPETSPTSAETLANKICKSIKDNTRKYGKDISCRAKTSAVYSEDLHSLITRIKNNA